jgi:hypothetical protein
VARTCLYAVEHVVGKLGLPHGVAICLLRRARPFSPDEPRADKGTSHGTQDETEHKPDRKVIRKGDRKHGSTVAGRALTGCKCGRVRRKEVVRCGSDQTERRTLPPRLWGRGDAATYCRKELGNPSWARRGSDLCRDSPISSLPLRPESRAKGRGVLMPDGVIPVIIFQTRYGGTYEGGRWAAIYSHPHDAVEDLRRKPRR